MHCLVRAAGSELLFAIGHHCRLGGEKPASDGYYNTREVVPQLVILYGCESNRYMDISLIHLRALLIALSIFMWALSIDLSPVKVVDKAASAPPATSHEMLLDQVTICTVTVTI